MGQLVNIISITSKEANIILTLSVKFPFRFFVFTNNSKYLKQLTENVLSVPNVNLSEKFEKIVTKQDKL